MNPKNRAALADRVAKAAEAALAERQFVSPIDVLVGIGWLDPGAVERWRRGQVDYLERVVQTNLSRISEAMDPPLMLARGKRAAVFGRHAQHSKAVDRMVRRLGRIRIDPAAHPREGGDPGGTECALRRLDPAFAHRR